MNKVSTKYLFLINAAVIMACTVLDFPQRDSALIALMLFLPVIDRAWTFRSHRYYRVQRTLWTVFIGVLMLIAVTHPDRLGFILFTVLLVALPEEWFFRAYFMQRVESISGNQWWANAMTSVLFALLHVPTQGWYGLSVFVPSMILGWFYQQHRDLVVVVLLHTLSNLVYLLYLHDALVFFNKL